jgi:hypothetical protein
MTNFIAQTLNGLPTFCLAILLLVLTVKKSKFRTNNFFICGSFLTIVQFIYNGLFWISAPTTNSLVNHSKIGIIFSPVFILFLYGTLQVILENNLSAIPRKRNLLTLVILFLITFGFYTPFWYVEKYSKHMTQSFLIVVFVLSLTFSFFLHTYLYADSNSFGSAIWLTVDILTIALGIVLAMNLRAMILKENSEIEINPILTFLLGIFYLQYRINQLNDANKSIGD